MSDKVFELDQLMPLIRERLASGESVSFSVHGTSMLPMLKDGRDQVILSQLPPKLKKYDLPLYQRDNGQYVLHRIIKVTDEYTCIGDNQFIAEKGLRFDQMIGVVTGFIRKGREYPTDNLSYQVYCRFWHYTRSFRFICRKIKIKLSKLKKKK